jgi:hypothetical protein
MVALARLLTAFNAVHNSRRLHCCRQVAPTRSPSVRGMVMPAGHPHASRSSSHAITFRGCRNSRQMLMVYQPLCAAGGVALSRDRGLERFGRCGRALAAGAVTGQPRACSPCLLWA